MLALALCSRSRGRRTRPPVPRRHARRPPVPSFFRSRRPSRRPRRRSAQLPLRPPPPTSTASSGSSAATSTTWSRWRSSAPPASSRASAAATSTSTAGCSRSGRRRRRRRSSSSRRTTSTASRIASSASGCTRCAPSRARPTWRVHRDAHLPAARRGRGGARRRRARRDARAAGRWGAADVAENQAIGGADVYWKWCGERFEADAHESVVIDSPVLGDLWWCATTALWGEAAAPTRSG